MLLQCSEEDKMLLGPFQLQEEAEGWVQGESDHLGDTVVTWEEF